MAVPAAAAAAAKSGAASQLGKRGRGLGAALLGLLVAAFLFLLLIIVAPFVLVVSVIGGNATSTTAVDYPAGSGIPEVYWPIYVTAGEYYGVSPYVIASIHRQETEYSTNPTTRAGFNSIGCCAGGMQINVEAGTWNRYKNSFRPIADKRPESYPLQRDELPSCVGVQADEGCVYDDYDTIAAGAAFLADEGADMNVFSKGTHDAVCAYIGACSEVNACTGSKNEYCQVLPRAQGWALTGAGPGSVTEAGSAPSVGGSGAKQIVDDAVAIALRYPGVYVCSDFRPGSITSSGHVSDHSANNANQAARDISMRGIDCIAGPPPVSLDRAAVEIGRAFGRDYVVGKTIIDTFQWRGFRVQIIWRTPLYGGHMGHIHIGARRTSLAST